MNRVTLKSNAIRCTAMTTEQHYDVLIIGGGPAACAAALTLKQAAPDVRLAVIASGDYSGWRIGETLAPSSSGLLTQLGLWETFLADPHLPAAAMASCWGQAQPGYYDFIINPHGYGWHLDRERFDQMLIRAVAQTSVDLLLPTTAVAVTFHNTATITVHLKHQGGSSKVHGQFVLDATGRQSWFARRAGAVRQNYDRLVAAYLHIPAANVNRDAPITLVEACELGWWYSTQLPDQSMLCGLFTDSDIAARHKLRQIDHWTALLRSSSINTQQRFSLKHLQQATPQLFAACSYWMQPCHRSNWLALGDAACTFDPLSAQGIDKALSDGIAAGHAVAALLAGDSNAVQDYANNQRCQFNNYLADHRRYYELEQRWPNAEFWHRRHTHISLSPHTVLSRSKHATPPIAMSGRQLGQSLLNYCTTPHTAATLVNDITQHLNMPDFIVIEALEKLLQQQLLTKNLSLT